MTLQRIATSIFSAAVLLIIGSSLVTAQTTDVLNVSYFLNEAQVEQASQSQRVYILDPGANGSANLCADIYVLNASESEYACCSCQLTPDELVSTTVAALESNTVNGHKPQNGVIKIIADSKCNATAPTPTPDLRAWMYHVVQVNGTWEPTSEEFQDAPLSTNEINMLANACASFKYSSGHGTCPCPTEVPIQGGGQ